MKYFFLMITMSFAMSANAEYLAEYVRLFRSFRTVEICEYAYLGYSSAISSKNRKALEVMQAVGGDSNCYEFTSGQMTLESRGSLSQYWSCGQLSLSEKCSMSAGKASLDQRN